MSAQREHSHEVGCLSVKLSTQSNEMDEVKTIVKETTVANICPYLTMIWHNLDKAMELLENNIL